MNHNGEIPGSESTPTADVPLELLVIGEGPRLDGDDALHIQQLAEVEESLPPILVHRRTMQVIDGRHRVQAARLRGANTITVEFCDGDDAATFVLAVERNVTHGLPLSRRDRHAAAARIIALNDEWSDRMIGRVTGLSARTVAAIRSCSTADSQQSNMRRGQDGRVRPVDNSDKRRHAARLMSEDPNASLRQIAQAVGISISTAHHIQRRLRGTASDPEVSRTSPTPRGRPNGADVEKDVEAILRCLCSDPAIRMNETGRRVVRWLSAHAIRSGEWQPLLNNLPPHHATTVATLARRMADSWSRLANELDQRHQTGRA